MKKGDILKMLEFVEDDVEILARDAENNKSYEIIGIKPTRTIEMVCIVLKERV
jgi:hypothetical protein